MNYCGALSSKHPSVFAGGWFVHARMRKNPTGVNYHSAQQTWWKFLATEPLIRILHTAPCRSLSHHQISGFSGSTKELKWCGSIQTMWQGGVLRKRMLTNRHSMGRNSFHAVSLKAPSLFNQANKVDTDTHWSDWRAQIRLTAGGRRPVIQERLRSE